MSEEETKRKLAIKRAEELKERIADYLAFKDSIPRGMAPIQEQKIENKKKNILVLLGSTEENWKDWQWQINNRICDLELLTKIIKLNEQQIEDIKKVQEKYRWGISPYYASLIDDEDDMCPIRLQSIPTFLELEEEGSLDPSGEENTNPAGSIIRRYPDRLIINVTNVCPSFCRHCQRRRNIGTLDRHQSKEALEESIEYIRKNPEIRDVLITGGDALMLSDSTLNWLLDEIHSIPTVDYIRIGTRVPVTLPQRITESLLEILKKYAPIYINTQFNHPKEITKAAKEACEKLADLGIPLGNQTVLLNGINNNKYVIRLLNQELLKCRVKPYYLFHSKNVLGTSHFNTSVDEGIEIMEYLRGYTSGLAIPDYIVSAPKGNGKTPILPDYILAKTSDRITLRTWENKIFDSCNCHSVDLEKLLNSQRN